MLKLTPIMLEGAAALLNYNQEIECTVTTREGTVDCYVDGITPEGIYVCRQLDRQRSWEPFLVSAVRVSRDTADMLIEALKQFGRPIRSIDQHVKPVQFDPFSDRPAHQLVQQFLQKRKAA